MRSSVSALAGWTVDRTSNKQIAEQYPTWHNSCAIAHTRKRTNGYTNDVCFWTTTYQHPLLNTLRTSDRHRNEGYTAHKIDGHLQHVFVAFFSNRLR